MDAAQAAYEEHLLSMPELAAPELVRVCAAMRGRGAAGAKFSGAGGDGSVVALFAERGGAEAARAWMAGEGIAAWVVPL
jgi:mevalonate kinase